jgi:UDP-N-acetylmuramate dehydrogenase
MQPLRDVALAPLTTFRLGGKARYFIEVTNDEEVAFALKWADDAHVSEIFVLGGGSNLVVADTSLSGLVIHTAQKGIYIDDRGSSALVRANAGERWDDLVRYCVERELVGLECLSGIPGLVGATPVQNVGAYGQDVGQTLSKVTVFDRKLRQKSTFTHDECALGYRDSRFKSHEPDRYIVLSVEFQLNRGTPEPLCHRELCAQLNAQGIISPSVRQIRQVVLAVRSQKSMLADPEDPLARSAGSFFVNPIVSKERALAVQSSCPDYLVPSWEMPDGRIKLAAAWLIEHAGFSRGKRFGSVGLSPHHCLVIVAHERAEAADVVRFAHQVRQGVHKRFGIELSPEPRFWGFDQLEAGLPSLDDDGPATLGSASWPAPGQD